MAALNNLAEELGIDFLVCGCNSVDDNGQVMIVGEMCDSSFWKKDTIVVKNTSFEVTQPLKFLLGEIRLLASRNAALKGRLRSSFSC